MSSDFATVKQVKVMSLIVDFLVIVPRAHLKQNENNQHILVDCSPHQDIV